MSRQKTTIARVTCPICGQSLGAITFRHVQAHGLTMEQFRAAHPGARLRHPDTNRIATAKSAATLRERIATDPAMAENFRKRGERLATLSVSLDAEERRERHARARATRITTSTPEERQEAARKGGKACAAAHPEHYHRAGAALADFKRRPEERANMAQHTKARWLDPAYRDNMVTKNRAHALSGRIPLALPGLRPTANERRMIAFCAKHKIDLLYVGDGSFRIDTPEGARHWRNPDFIEPGSKKAVLLDSFLADTHEQEIADYRAAGWSVIRVALAEIEDARWLTR